MLPTPPPPASSPGAYSPSRGLFTPEDNVRGGHPHGQAQSPSRASGLREQLHLVDGLREVLPGSWGQGSAPGGVWAVRSWRPLGVNSAATGTAAFSHLSPDDWQVTGCSHLMLEVWRGRGQDTSRKIFTFLKLRFKMQTIKCRKTTQSSQLKTSLSVGTCMTTS